MNIAILGYGKISTMLINLLKNNEKLKVVKILEYQDVIDEIYDYEIKEVITSNFLDILYDDSVDLIIECFENRDFSFNYVKEALKKKKHFILTNLKIASNNDSSGDLETLINIAKKNGVSFRYQTCLNCNNGLLRLIDEINEINKFDLIEGTFSPICNYLINLMANGMTFENAIDSLRATGFKEESIEYEISGAYSRDLIKFLGDFSLKTKLNKDDIYVYPIRTISESDIKTNLESGYEFKYLTYLKNVSGKLSVIVEPVLVSQTNKFHSFKLDSLVHLNTNFGRDIYLSLDSYHDKSIASYLILEALSILENKNDLNYENECLYKIDDEVYSRYYIHFKNEIKGTTERITRKELAKILNDVKFYARIID